MVMYLKFQIETGGAPKSGSSAATLQIYFLAAR